MVRTLVLESIEKIGKKVKLAGWVKTVRDHGKITFIDLRDRSGVIQCVGQNLPKVSVESVVEVEGLIKERPVKLINPKIETGKIEIQIESLKILSFAQELPFDMGKEDLDLELSTLLDFRPLTLRNPKVNAIFKVQEVVIDSFRKAMKAKDFFEFQSPVFIPEVAEGGAEVFKVPYFGHEVYLSQSPQLYKQILVGAYERVFTVNETLRAEPSMTTRHLTEVTTLDAEFGFIDSWMDVKEMAEYTIKYMLKAVEKECSDILKEFGTTIPKFTENIPMIKLREAQEIIYKRTGRDNRKEPDLEPEDEREICRWSLEEKDNDLIFISHYPVKKRPFYTYPDPDDPEYTMSFDLLGRGTEWMTGGRRINDYKFLLKMAKERNVDPKKLDLYLQAFKFGMPPEGGYSFGSERITMHILGLKNIREASLFPRDMERVDVRLSTLKNDQVSRVSKDKRKGRK
ncbi:aspartate--tRNA(Asn) ligase [Candidatus Woesebacteria bacterium RIFCSPHIGHO2_02_FULL_38_9]|uniref:Aspartate--tRNA ligase n=1 Tax=Candidatus Woesebacteria bacterium RIFCSPHIGHO2_01_FULL_39_28 TaxID=1802496 RepID=A0A1F7YH60_9BACT|nr:MAG: aspartate--tRNA(Asn) ligase [Candidatus Woesebacteria bacterium RIFCSPHIGHO2_01_FULL_39_28]OGM31717.1 MAG: aspartate--tRNA(Asn) ligase [Candidatus Woesebacteria bacterium RIFCSPHIGHO2_02_FULL_38_9]OGM57658.1 MAG: aspartate--tRNA(Asn) ligase [Candidatus Woesebacteria bacterium RIFCSPLOWO2_01_FULL_38_20]